MPYNRIISLVPSLTELIIDLGLIKQTVGRTKFCIHPINKVQKITPIGGTKNPDIEQIISLKPDLIIANKEENRKEDIEILSKHFEILLTEIDTIDDALEWIGKIGTKLGVEEMATKMIHNIDNLSPNSSSYDTLQTAYFIWKNPWMTIGNDTYIHDVMKNYGFTNVYGDKTRYPETNFHELADLKPDVILLSSEPYPFKQKHVNELLSICPNSVILLVNGEWFSWYGSRMISSFKELRALRKEIFTK